MQHVTDGLSLRKAKCCNRVLVLHKKLNVVKPMLSESLETRNSSFQITGMCVLKQVKMGSGS